MIRKNVSKRKNLEVFFCCTMSALPLTHIIVKEMVRVINTWIRLRFFWRKSFKENPGKDFSLPLSPLSSFEFWCKTNFYLFIAVALITITCAANFLQLSKKQTSSSLPFPLTASTQLDAPTDRCFELTNCSLGAASSTARYYHLQQLCRRKPPEEAGFGLHV